MVIVNMAVKKNNQRDNGNRTHINVCVVMGIENNWAIQCANYSIKTIFFICDKHQHVRLCLDMYNYYCSYMHIIMLPTGNE